MWAIIRTDFRKEHYVASQIGKLGFDAWVPSQIIVTRDARGRRVMARSQLQTIKELPILPKRIFAALPSWIILHQDELNGIRHYAGLERDGEQRVVWVPTAQITAFRAEIDRENTASLALAQRAGRKQKAQWKSLHDALLEMIEAAKQTMEQAA